MAASAPQDPGELPRPRTSHYPSGGTAAEQHSDPVSQPARKWPAPPQHQRLLALTRLSAGLYTLAVLGAFLIFLSTDATVISGQLGLSAEQAASFVRGVIFGILFSLALALCFYRLVYKGLKRGKKWARSLGIVFASISVVATTAGLLQPLTYGGWEVVHIVIRIAGIVVDILWLVTALRKPLPRWFALPF